MNFENKKYLPKDKHKLSEYKFVFDILQFNALSQNEHEMQKKWMSEFDVPRDNCQSVRFWRDAANSLRTF